MSALNTRSEVLELQQPAMALFICLSSGGFCPSLHHASSFSCRQPPKFSTYMKTAGDSIARSWTSQSLVLPMLKWCARSLDRMHNDAAPLTCLDKPRWRRSIMNHRRHANKHTYFEPHLHYSTLPKKASRKNGYLHYYKNIMHS